MQASPFRLALLLVLLMVLGAEGAQSKRFLKGPDSDPLFLPTQCGILPDGRLVVLDGARGRLAFFNDRGEFRLPARLDPGLKRGCVSVTNGWWIPEGGTVNFCSAGRETDIGYGAAFHDTLVQVEPWR